MKYAVIPIAKAIPVHYTNDVLEAVTLFAAYASRGMAVTLSRRHEGDDKPTDYYDVIDQANM